MQIIKLDLSRNDVPQTVVAKQGDVGRKFQAELTDNNREYPVPEGAALSAWYSGTSGMGNYSCIGERSAFAVNGSTVTVELITQMLQNKGGGTMCLILHGADGTQLGMWNIPYIVESVPGMDSAGAQQYFTALSESATKAQAAAAAAEKTLSGKLPVGLYSRETVWVDSREDQKTAKFWDQIIAVYDSMVAGTVELVQAVVVYSFTDDHNEPGGGTYRVTITKSRDEKWGFVEARSYHADKFGAPYLLTRLKRDGNWLDVVNTSGKISDKLDGQLLWKNEAMGTLWNQDSIPLPKAVYDYDTLMVLVALNTSLYYTMPVFIKTAGHSKTGVAYFPAGECDSHSWKAHWRTFFFVSDPETPYLTMSKGYLDGTVSSSRAVPYMIYGCNTAKNRSEVETG